MSEPSRQDRPSGGVIPGLLKGLATTARSVTRRHHTVEYPDVKPKLPPRTRGVIALTEENCTSCMLCARECPDWCIYIDSHKEEIPATTPGGRARQRNVLDRFAIDFSLCMYCGICVEVCPFDALHWSPEFEYSEIDIRDLLHEKDRLAQWMATVPPPPALDPGSPEPAEVAALNRPVRPAPGAARAAAAEGAPGQTTRPERPARRTDRPAPSGDRPARPATARRTPAPGTTPPPEVEPTEPAHTATPAEEASAAPPTESAADPSTESAAAPTPERAAAPAEGAAAGPPETPAPGGPIADRTGDQTQPMPSAAPPDDTQQLPPASEPTETGERPGPAETQVLPPARPEREDS